MGKRNVNSSALWGVIIGVLIALITTVVMALVFATILNKSGAGERLQNAMTVCIWGISVIVGNAVLSCLQKDKKVIWILAVGIIYFTILLINNILLFDGLLSGAWRGLLSVGGGILLSVALFGRVKARKKHKARYRTK